MATRRAAHARLAVPASPQPAAPNVGVAGLLRTVDLSTGDASLVPVSSCVCSETNTGDWTVAVLSDSPLGPANATPLCCYVCCPVSKDKTQWLAALCDQIRADEDEGTCAHPVHAADLRFPFQLPLYPRNEVLLVAFTATVRPEDVEAIMPLYLGQPPRGLVTAIELMPLVPKLWDALGSKDVWDNIFPNVRVALGLSFDALPPAALEDIVDEWEVPLSLCEMDALGVVVAAPAQGAVPASEITATAPAYAACNNTLHPQRRAQTQRKSQSGSSSKPAGASGSRGKAAHAGQPLPSKRRRVSTGGDHHGGAGAAAGAGGCVGVGVCDDGDTDDGDLADADDNGDDLEDEDDGGDNDVDLDVDDEDEEDDDDDGDGDGDGSTHRVRERGSGRDHDSDGDDNDIVDGDVEIVDGDEDEDDDDEDDDTDG